MIYDILPRIAGKIFLNVISKSDPDGVYLTFDDGPDPEITPQLLDELKRLDCLATFFITGSKAEKYISIVKQIHNAGHTIASHGYHHRSLALASQKNIRVDLKRSIEILSDITGHRPHLFRPPYGRIGPNLLKVVKELGLITVLWSVSAGDWHANQKEALIHRIIHHVKDGDIILLHDSGGNGTTLSSISEIIKTFRMSGFILQTLKNVSSCNY